VPDLELYREHGLLWTKVIGSNQSSRHLPNPRSPERTHCIALANPIYIDSSNGRLRRQGHVEYAIASRALRQAHPQGTVIQGKHKRVDLPKQVHPQGTVIIQGKHKRVDLPKIEDLSLLSDSWLHDLNHPLRQIDEVIPALLSKGYILELPTKTTWHSMLDDINKMCHGIAVRFKQPTDEEQADLANEALIQVIRKLVDYKLVYTPGLAPVFNLLTTTIHRCMYSIMNRRKTQRTGLQKFSDEVQAGIVPGYKSNVRIKSC